MKELLLKTYTTVALGNPIKALETKVDSLSNKVDNFVYWINPVNWFKEAGEGIYHLVSSGNLDVPLLIVTIAGIWLIMLGAKKPKKLLFWTWIGFWLLRGVLWV